MKDLEKSKDQLVYEMLVLRKHVDELRTAEAKYEEAHGTLIENEKRYRLLVDNIPVHIGAIGTDGKFFVWNRTSVEMLGYTPEEVMGRMTPADIHETKKEAEEVVRIAAEKGIFDRELNLRHKDGTLVPVRLVVTPYKGPDGKITAFYGFAEDMTKRRSAEDALSRRDYQLEVLSRTSFHIHAILEQSQVMRTLCAAAMELVGGTAAMAGLYKDGKMVFTEYNKGGAIHTINYAFNSGYGIPGHIIQTLKPYISNDAEHDEHVIPEIRNVLGIYNLASIPIIGRAGKLIGCIEIHNKEDRKPFDAQDLFMLQGLAASAAIALDNAKMLEERKETEEALRESEEKYRRIIENTNDVVMLTQPDGRISYLSPACRNVLGYDAKELIGKEPWIVHPDDLKKVKEAFGKSLDGSVGTNFEYRILTKDGKTKWISHSWAPIMKEGNLQLVVSVIRDTTERKQSEKELEALNEELLKTNESLKQIALRDVETELFNHSYLNEILEPEFYRAKRYGHPLSVMMIDIDYFKSINDVYGHDFGDLVLKQFAKNLTKLVRRYDVVIRYGGEEFLILSSGTDRHRAMGQAQRILDSMSVYKFGDKKRKVKLKLSIAVASYPEDDISKPTDLIACASKVLEKVKDKGGNKVYSSTDVSGGKKTFFRREESNDIRYLKEKIDKLTKRERETLIESVFALAKTIELKDKYTSEHAEETIRNATHIAKGLGLAGDDIESIREAAVLHDLGKIGISDKILLKKAKLSKKEFEEIKRHPQIAADIIRPLHFMHDIIPFILYHHERWDGKGYPTGLKGDEIPLGARIISVADAYQALTSNRPYRKAYSKEDAMKIIREGSGTQFDPNIVEILLKMLKNHKK